MANYKNPDEKQPGEHPDGKFHHNPGNMSGKKLGPGADPRKPWRHIACIPRKACGLATASGADVGATLLASLAPAGSLVQPGFLFPKSLNPRVGHRVFYASRQCFVPGRGRHKTPAGRNRFPHRRRHPEASAGYQSTIK
jgi:hypothetical protein